MQTTQHTTSTQDPMGRLFIANTTREALAQIRAELGADAVILNQTTRNGRVEILASTELPPSRRELGAVATDRDEHPPTGELTLADVFPDTTGLEPADNTASVAPKLIEQRLAELGFESHVARRLPTNIRHWQQLKTLLPALFGCQAGERHFAGSCRFIGAPGAGKTTTIIKLMTEHVLHHGPAAALLISTDHRRLGGCEALALAAELLGVDYLEVRESDLPIALESQTSKQLTLVDTAGLCFGQPGCPAASVNDYLVVPAMWQASALRRLKRQLTSQPLAGTILTHVDQAEALGPCLSVLAEWHVPLLRISRGPELPDDLEQATPELLSALALAGIDRSQMSATFA